MSQSPELGLQLTGLKKILGGRVIIDNLDLDIKKGEMVSLLGPSGCGKTTTLRMVAGFLIPDEGRVLLAGNDVTPLGQISAQVRWFSRTMRSGHI